MLLLLDMAYRSFGRFRQAFTHLDTPPSSLSHHPVSDIAPAVRQLHVSERPTCRERHHRWIWVGGSDEVRSCFCPSLPAMCLAEDLEPVGVQSFEKPRAGQRLNRKQDGPVAGV